MKPTIYLISGLGADSRIFKNLNLQDFQFKYLEWTPIIENESLESYALKLSKQILDENPILLGVSFGGLMAIEISKIINTDKIIIVSSIKSSEDFPFIFKILDKLKLHKYIPNNLINNSNYFTYWFFGLKKKEDKLMLKNILKDTDPLFFKWAIDKLLSWNNTYVPFNLIHIHGDNDRLIPKPSKSTCISIKSGGHLMIFTHAKEILKKINQQLESP
jgi:pimeloyl-ACP methyl ester carboxylesterase